MTWNKNVDRIIFLLIWIFYADYSQVDRRFPTVFKEGEPNLLLVSKGIFFFYWLELCNFHGCRHLIHLSCKKNIFNGFLQLNILNQVRYLVACCLFSWEVKIKRCQAKKKWLFVMRTRHQKRYGCINVFFFIHLLIVLHIWVPHKF